MTVHAAAGKILVMGSFCFVTFPVVLVYVVLALLSHLAFLFEYWF